MMLKGIFKNSSFGVQLFVLIFILITGALFSSLLFYLVTALKGELSIEMLKDPSILYQDSGILRMMMFFNSVGTFFFPALLLAYLFSDDKKEYLQIKEYASFNTAFYIVLSMLVLQPFINLTVEVNGMITLPKSMKGIEDLLLQMEEEAKQILEKILYTKNLLILIFNIIIVGLIAAVGEEFFFRGILQNVFRKILRNEHLIIWVAAIIFSAIHLQFYGFIPRVLLGAYFGYLLYYTKNIWAPVLAHFVHNAFGIIGCYIFQDTKELEVLDSMGTGSYWWLGLLSFLLWMFLFVKIVRLTKQSS